MPKEFITFFNEPVAYSVFFENNGLFKYSYLDNDINIFTITLTGKEGGKAQLFIKSEQETYHIYILGYIPLDLDDYEDNNKTLQSNKIIKNDDVIVSFKVKRHTLPIPFNMNDPRKMSLHNDYNGTLIIEFDRKIMENTNDPMLIIKKTSSGGRKASVKKEVCGKLRCIYTIAGSRKEHIKYKGQLIAVADYKKLMKKS